MSEEKSRLIEGGLSEKNAEFVCLVANGALNTLAMQGSLQMMAFIQYEEDEEQSLGIMAMPEMSAELKDIIVEVIRFKAYKMNADAVAILSEMWMMPDGLTPDEIEKLRDEYDSIEAMPNRREGVVVGLNTKTEKAMITYVISRDENNIISNVAIDTVNTSKEGNEIKGRMMETLYRPEDMAHPNFKQRLEISELILSMLEQEISIDHIERNSIN